MALDFSNVMTGHYGQMIIDGTVVTLELALGAWLLAMFIALVLVMIRLSNKRFAQLLVAAYVSYHRNVPTLIQLMMWYFAIPTLLPESLQMWVNEMNAEFLFSLVALGLCRAAYFSEDIRSGLRAISQGRMRRRGRWEWGICAPCGW